MLALLKKYAGRALQLADNDPLGPVDDERAPVGHKWDVSEENILLNALGVDRFVLLIRDMQDQPDFQGHHVADPPVEALAHGVLGRAEVVVHILQHIVAMTVLHREHALENRFETFVVALFGQRLGL